jgi:hypothetical protein
VTYSLIVELSCGCVRHPRNIRRHEIPEIGSMTECLTHGSVEVTHTTYVSN